MDVDGMDSVSSAIQELFQRNVDLVWTKVDASMVLKCLAQGTEKSCLVASGVTLSVNMVVADRLGITLPAELLNQAELFKCH